MMWYGHGLGFGLGWLWLILAIAGLALLVYVAVRLTMRGSSAPPPGASPTQAGSPPGAGSSVSALRILEERYARGEIDTDEFTERRRTLDGR